MPNLAAGTGNGIRITDDSALMEIGLRKDGSGNRRLAIFEDGGTYPLALQEDGGNVGRVDKSANSNKNLEKSMPHGTRSQLDKYRMRKKILFKRMQLGAIAMCLLIMFLVWLQDYIPSYNRKFWSRGIGPYTLITCLSSLRPS